MRTMVQVRRSSVTGIVMFTIEKRDGGHYYELQKNKIKNKKQFLTTISQMYTKCNSRIIIIISYIFINTK